MISAPMTTYDEARRLLLALLHRHDEPILDAGTLSTEDRVVGLVTACARIIEETICQQADRNLATSLRALSRLADDMTEHIAAICTERRD